jgi:hypothetical protein
VGAELGELNATETGKRRVDPKMVTAAEALHPDALAVTPHEILRDVLMNGYRGIDIWGRGTIR